jgi:hypothetical protein
VARKQKNHQLNKKLMNTLKLRPLIENIAVAQAAEPKKEWTSEVKKAALENIGCYNEYGRHLHRETSLMEISHKLNEIVKEAKELALHETEKAALDEKAWFDEQTVRKNCAVMEKSMAEFSKLAKEAHILEQRMQATYEDIGHMLERYYEVKDLQEGQAAISKIVNH